MRAVVVTGADVTEEELIAFCRTRLAGYETKRHVEYGEVTLEFDATGAATKATVAAPLGEVTKCVEDALRTVRAPCPAVAKSSAQGHLAITLARP